jgi:hypothetical protein
VITARGIALALLTTLLACGGGSSSPDLAVTACPADITSVNDGDPCAGNDQQCSTCDPGCGSCAELFCQNGTWIHVLEHGACDAGSDGAGD